MCVYACTTTHTRAFGGHYELQNVKISPDTIFFFIVSLQQVKTRNVCCILLKKYSIYIHNCMVICILQDSSLSLVCYILEKCHSSLVVERDDYPLGFLDFFLVKVLSHQNGKFCGCDHFFFKTKKKDLDLRYDLMKPEPNQYLIPP